MNDKIIKKIFKLAKKSLKKNEFPVAAIIYCGNHIISCGYNTRNLSEQTIDHAEINAIRKANKKLKSWRLTNTCMLVTLEPCDMCKAVIREARIDRVYYLVSRYNYKKQNKCSIFEYLYYNGYEIENYKRDIKNFFVNKR